MVYIVGQTKSVFRYLSEGGHQSNRSPKEKEEFISNPLNAFSLIRRTSEDLPKWYTYFKDSIKNGEF